MNAINFEDISNVFYSILGGNLFAVVFCVFIGVMLKLDVIGTLYGSIQVIVILQFTYFIIILRW